MIQLPDFLTEKFERLADFLKEKKYVALSCIILVVFTICAFIVFSVHSCTTTSEKKAPVQENLPRQNQSFSPLQPIVQPEGPSAPEGYALSRQPEPRWTTQEIEQEFTLPEQNNLNDLQKANDNAINEILGAAP
ncbi:MAG: hypothetical protein ACI4LR_03880 [Treponema sp.]